MRCVAKSLFGKVEVFMSDPQLVAKPHSLTLSLGDKKPGKFTVYETGAATTLKATGSDGSIAHATIDHSQNEVTVTPVKVGKETIHLSDGTKVGSVSVTVTE